MLEQAGRKAVEKLEGKTLDIRTVNLEMSGGCRKAPRQPYGEDVLQ